MQYESKSQSFAHRYLPWLLAGVMLVVYAVTLSRWITFSGAAVQARMLGWDWQPVLHTPLYFLLTFPIRWLPGGWQIVGLNAFSALCSVITLALLARSVALLPHDRTRDQRQFERSEYAFLSVPASWLPPVLAVLVCGLQMTFWEHAVVASGEALDLLVFAWVIWELLEYRIDQRESRLFRAGFAYGLGIANNFAMIGFAPAFLLALVWIKIRDFFDGRFLLRLVLWGLAGLSLYLLLPAINTLSGLTDQTFWDLLRSNLGAQKNALASFPRFLLLFIGLTSLFPVFFIGIKWPAQFGDISAVGNALTNLMTHVIHGVFLLACLYVAFDPGFSPRELGGVYGYPLLTFYYLGALSVGYFAGYFLLVFAPSAAVKAWQRRPALWRRLLHWAVTAAVWLALAVPAGLVYQNLPQLRTNHTAAGLSQFGTLAARSLPPDGGVLLSDDVFRLYAVRAALADQADAGKYLCLDTTALPRAEYHRVLRQRYGTRWPLMGFEKGAAVDINQLVAALDQLVRAQEVYYLHPSFGYYFEHFHLKPRGLVYRLQPYATNELTAPALTAAELQENEAAWQALKTGTLADVIQARQARHPKAASRLPANWLAMMYSRGVNHLGVEFQRAGQLEKAAAFFNFALELNPDNPAAFLNLDYNQLLREGKRENPAPSEGVVQRAAPYGNNWESILNLNGPVDEPNTCFLLAQVFAKGRNFRQAAQQLTRTIHFNPDHLPAREALAGCLVQARFPDQALTLIEETRKLSAAATPLGTSDKLSLLQSEAWAYVGKHDLPRAERLLTEAQAQYPQRSTPFATMAEIYLSLGRISNALSVLEAQLNVQPEELNALANYAALQMKTGNLAEAIPYLDRALKLNPNYPYALLNRAIAYLQTGKIDEAQRDYATLERTLPKPVHSVYYGLGETAKLKKNFKDAIQYYEQYLKLAPAGTPEINYIREQIKRLKSGL